MMRKAIALAVLAVALAAPAAGKEKAAAKVMDVEPGSMTFYQQKNYNGDVFLVEKSNGSIVVDWPIRSIAIHPGDKWAICLKPRFREPCVELTESLPDTSVIGLSGGLGSAKLIAAGGK
jgi:hypothetical protein